MTSAAEQRHLHAVPTPENTPETEQERDERHLTTIERQLKELEQLKRELLSEKGILQEKLGRATILAEAYPTKEKAKADRIKFHEDQITWLKSLQSLPDQQRAIELKKFNRTDDLLAREIAEHEKEIVRLKES